MSESIYLLFGTLLLLTGVALAILAYGDLEASIDLVRKHWEEEYEGHLCARQIVAAKNFKDAESHLSLWLSPEQISQATRQATGAYHQLLVEKSQARHLRCMDNIGPNLVIQPYRQQNSQLPPSYPNWYYQLQWNDHERFD